jgi:hypothetical protein
MPKPKGRHHFPCRVCKRPHTNPASSSICSDCGREESFQNSARRARGKEEEDSLQVAGNDAYVTQLLREELGISMKDAATFLLAFRICAENINGN